MLNSLSFTAGVNATVPQNYNNTYSIAETMTIGAGTSQITIPFNLNISYSDTLTIVGGTTFSFLDGSTLWQVAVNGLTLGPNAGGTHDRLVNGAGDRSPVSAGSASSRLPTFRVWAWRDGSVCLVAEAEEAALLAPPDQIFRVLRGPAATLRFQSASLNRLSFILASLVEPVRLCCPR